VKIIDHGKFKVILRFDSVDFNAWAGAALLSAHHRLVKHKRSTQCLNPVTVR
jgi:hypothetical protein